MKIYLTLITLDELFIIQFFDIKMPHLCGAKILFIFK